MSISTFQAKAAEVSARLSGAHSDGKRFSAVAAEVSRALVAYGGVAGQEQPSEHDAEWQRVNSYIADVLKDTHVLYAKLARLQGDFIGAELNELEKISSDVLNLGEKLSVFMKAFHEGDASMMKEKTFGGGGGGGAPPGTPPPSIPSEFQRPEGDFETELDLEGEGDFEGFEDEEEKKDGEKDSQGQ